MGYALLAMVDRPRRGLRAIVVAGAMLGALVLLDVWVFPERMVSWWSAVTDTAVAERGHHAPSLWSMVGDRAPVSTLVVLGGLATTSIVALARTRNAPRLDRLMFAVVAITLCWPRLKDYGFMMLIPPTATLVAALWRPRLGPGSTPGPLVRHGRWAISAIVLGGAVVLTRPPASHALSDHWGPLAFALGLWAASLLSLIYAHQASTRDEVHGDR